MKISIIVAMALNRVIGINNTLPWKLPEDLKHFKSLTLGNILVIGRKTFESIGRPLPGRETIVVTRQENYKQDGIKTACSLEQAIKTAQRLSQDKEIFIAGGAEIYQQSLNLADTIYLTLIEKEFLGDTYFPNLDLKSWQLEEGEFKFSPVANLNYKFQTCSRLVSAQSTQNPSNSQ